MGIYPTLQEFVGIKNKKEFDRAYGETTRQIVQGYYNISVEGSLWAIRKKIKAFTDIFGRLKIGEKVIFWFKSCGGVFSVWTKSGTLVFNPLMFDKRVLIPITNHNFSMKPAKIEELAQFYDDIVADKPVLFGAYFQKHDDWFVVGSSVDFYIDGKVYRPRIVSKDLVESEYGKFYIGFEFNRKSNDS